MRVPAALAAIPLLAGSTLSLLIWPAPGPDLPVTGAGAAALALLAAAAERDRAAVCTWIVAGCFLAGLTLGCGAAGRAYEPSLLRWFALHQPRDPVLLEGTLREDAIPTPQGVSLSLNVERAGAQEVAGGVRVSIGGSLSAAHAGEWRRGRRVRMPVLLRRPTVYRDPGVPDAARALARRGICLVGSVKSAALVQRVADGSRLQEAAAGARAWARRRLAAAIGPAGERSAAVATAILIGDRQQLDPDDERRLQRAGTYHVIAISGGNIAIVTALLLAILRAVCLPQGPAATIAIAGLLFYGQLTGPAASVERAVTAAVLFLSARVLDHRGPPLNALAIAAAFSVAAEPVAVLDPGFLLSFGATLGILLGTPLMVGPLTRSRAGRAARLRRSCRRALLAVLAATICAELALLPIGASLFGRATFAGLLLNFAAIPLMTIVQLAGAAVLAVPALWSSLSGASVSVAHGAATGLVESARLVDVLPWLSVPVSAPSWPLVAAYYAGAFGLLVPRVRAQAIAVLTAVAVLLLAGPGELRRDHLPAARLPLRVVFLDVGQGDATLLVLPSGHALLVDAGGLAAYAPPPGEESASTFDVGERVVLPALRALGISRLDALVLTHGDPDHALGAPAVLRELMVESVWEGVPVPAHAGLRALAADARRVGSTWRTVQAGDRERFGDVELRVLHPPPPEWERQRVRNDDSIVLELRLGRVSIVLAGDIGKEGEHAILPRLEPGRLTVLKAGHHGSATSSTPELLSALDPAAVIFSAGRDNRFQHPHPDVLRRFEARGTAVFRTDRDGAVFLETDGTTVEVRGWVSSLLPALGRTTVR